jgi:hypothetical protein
MQTTNFKIINASQAYSIQSMYIFPPEDGHETETCSGYWIKYSNQCCNRMQTTNFKIKDISSLRLEKQVFILNSFKQADGSINFTDIYNFTNHQLSDLYWVQGIDFEMLNYEYLKMRNLCTRKLFSALHSGTHCQYTCLLSLSLKRTANTVVKWLRTRVCLVQGLPNCVPFGIWVSEPKFLYNSGKVWK